MTIYYVYAYLRTNGTPYYIGKGTGNRAWTDHRYKSPKNNYYKGISTPPPSRIVILETNLTAVGAFALERRMIRWYGRIDTGTGILHNRTDGGEGLDGVVRTEDWKNNIRKASVGKTKSDSHKKKLSLALMGNTPWNKGLEGTKYEKRRNQTEFTFVHRDGRKETCTMYQLREKYSNLSQGNLSNVVAGRKKSHMGWTIEKYSDASHRKS